jgi:hypothetical protein
MNRFLGAPERPAVDRRDPEQREKYSNSGFRVNGFQEISIFRKGQVWAWPKGRGANHKGHEGRTEKTATDEL